MCAYAQMTCAKYERQTSIITARRLPITRSAFVTLDETTNCADGLHGESETLFKEYTILYSNYVYTNDTGKSLKPEGVHNNPCTFCRSKNGF